MDKPGLELCQPDSIPDLASCTCCMHLLPGIPAWKLQIEFHLCNWNHPMSTWQVRCEELAFHLKGVRVGTRQENRSALWEETSTWSHVSGFLFPDLEALFIHLLFNTCFSWFLEVSVPPYPQPCHMSLACPVLTLEGSRLISSVNFLF